MLFFGLLYAPARPIWSCFAQTFEGVELGFVIVGQGAQWCAKLLALLVYNDFDPDPSGFIILVWFVIHITNVSLVWVPFGLGGERIIRESINSHYLGLTHTGSENSYYCLCC